MERLTNKREADAQREGYERRLANGYPRSLPVERFLRLAAYEDSGCEPEEVLPKDKADEIALKLMRLADLESLCSYDRIKELTKADKDGRIAILPCEPGGVMLDMSDLERPMMMERFHFAVAYVRCGIVFHQPYKIFLENVTAGHIRPVSGWAGKMLREEV